MPFSCCPLVFPRTKLVSVFYFLSSFWPEILNHDLELGPCPPAGTGFSGLRPELGKNRKNIGFGLPQKIKERKKKKPKNRKMSRKLPKNGVLGSFSYFSAIFFLFSGGGPKPIFFLSFAYFGPEARKPRSSRRAGSQIWKV